jgi:hypothetical protein
MRWIQVCFALSVLFSSPGEEYTGVRDVMVLKRTYYAPAVEAISFAGSVGFGTPVSWDSRVESGVKTITMPAQETHTTPIHRLAILRIKIIR